MISSDNTSKRKTKEVQENIQEKSPDYENSALKFRLYPDENQIQMLEKTFGCCRKVWNLMLEDKQKMYSMGIKAAVPTPASYKQEYSFLKEADSLALANVQINLKKAFKRFFEKAAGFPKFKSKHNPVQSYTTNNQFGNTAHSTIKIVDNKHIKLPKIGVIKASVHRFPLSDWELRSATVSRNRDGRYYISVLFRYPVKEKTSSVPELSKAIGLDYKSNGLYMDSEGNAAAMPKFYQRSHEKLAKEQRKLSCKKGARKGEKKSHRYIKQLKKLNRIHAHIANQRKDFLHKISREITNLYDIVCVETLDMKAVANKGFGNGKATMNNAYGMFLSMLEYKLARKGGLLIKIDKWFPSSQLCSRCHNRQKLALKDRVYNCPCCGSVMDRDHNAAINIRDEGLKQLMPV